MNAEDMAWTSLGLSQDEFLQKFEKCRREFIKIWRTEKYTDASKKTLQWLKEGDPEIKMYFILKCLDLALSGCLGNAADAITVLVALTDENFPEGDEYVRQAGESQG